MIYAKGKVTFADGTIKEFQTGCETLEEAIALFNSYTELENVKLFNFTLNYRN